MAETAGRVCRAGKYLWVQKDHVKDQALWAEDATWQYWVDDRVDGKADGTPHASRMHARTCRRACGTLTRTPRLVFAAIASPS